MFFLILVAALWVLCIFLNFALSYVCHVFRSEDKDELDEKWSRLCKRDSTGWYLCGAPFVLIFITLDFICLILYMIIMKYLKYFLKNSDSTKDINFKGKDLGDIFAEAFYAIRDAKKEDK